MVTSPTSRPLGRTINSVVVIAIAIAGAMVAAALVVAVVVRDPPRSGFRLQTTTMLTSGTWTPAATADCPSRIATSPLDFRPDGSLADEIPLYPGELISVRIDVVPDDAPIPEVVNFVASWPQTVVEPTGPTCAFVVDDGATNSRLEWRPTGDGEASFRLDNLRPWVPTTVEVWLAAGDPQAGVALGTSLTADASAGASVVDVLGGRVLVAERPGAPAVAEITDVSELVDGEVVVRAEVRPSVPTDPAFGASARLEAGPNVDVVLIDGADERCSGGEVVSCEIGDLAAGDVYELSVAVRLEDGWSPLVTADCDNVAGIIESGLCLELEADAAGAESFRDRRFVSAPEPDLGPLNVRLQRDPAVVRSDRVVRTVLVASAGEADLGSLEVTGSDCLEVERIPNSLDDGDGFLEVDENWWYSCSLDTTRRFLRFDLVGVTATGERVTATHQGPVTVISPALEVTVDSGEDGSIIVVANVGDTPISDVSVSATGCRSAVADEVPAEVLDPGAALTLQCVRVAETVRAYGLDVSDRPVAAIWPPPPA